ncbi:Toxin YhaV [Shigella sonnei]|nr:Toxin YhaV [Shigella sonnei]
MDFPQRVNGWALYAHPCFQETYDALVAEVETLKGKDPENYQRKAATKLLAVVHKVIYRLFFRYSEKEKVIILGWMNG